MEILDYIIRVNGFDEWQKYRYDMATHFLYSQEQQIRLRQKQTKRPLDRC